MVGVQVAHRGLGGCATGDRGGGVDAKGKAPGIDVVLVFYRAIGLELTLVGQAQAVFAVEVPDGAGFWAANRSVLVLLNLGSVEETNSKKYKAGHSPRFQATY
jgi:hypothetical protein